MNICRRLNFAFAVFQAFQKRFRVIQFYRISVNHFDPAVW